jgi:glycosyltransferase involved in cell wall biosynthesis
MKILWVKCDFLHPTTKGGQIRTLETLRRLHQWHEIHYVAFRDPCQPEGPARAAEYCTHAYPLTLRTPPRASLAFAGQLVRNLVSPLPLSIARYCSEEMRRTVGELLRRERFDSLVCDFLSAAPNVPNIEQAVLFQHNVETMIWRRHAAQGSFARRKYFEMQAGRMFRYESDVCRRAGRVIAVSRDDARVLTELCGATNVAAIPTGVDISYFAPPSQQIPSTADLVFVGSMDWMPNIDGITWFLEEILPRIHRKRPAATVAIVGRKPTREIAAFATRDSRIQVTGTLPDIRPWLWGSSVSIVPLRIGGGTRLKIYEAMAARVPVVSTGIGAEGLDIHPPDDIRIADTPEDFSEQCLELLGNTGLRSEIAHRAWDMVSSEFSWEQVARSFSQILETSPGPR